MSLINQMLADLEARRGGRLDSSARALEGLQPVFLALPGRGDGPLRLLVAALGGAGIAALTWYGVHEFAPAGALQPPAALAQTDVRPPASVASPAPTALVETTGIRLARDVAPAELAPEQVPEVATVAKVERAAVAELEPAVESQAEPEVAVEAAQPAQPDAVAPADQPGHASLPNLLAAAPAAPMIEYRGTVRMDRHVDPDDPAVALAGILPRLHGPGQTRAQRDLERLVARVPTFLPARQALASELLRSRQTAAAERVLRAGLASTPKVPRLAEMLAHLLVARGDVAGALAVLHEARPEARGDVEYLAFVAALEQRLGHHVNAVASYRAALAILPSRGAWWAGLAISLSAQGLVEEARAAYGRALADRALSANLRRYAERERARLSAAG